MKLRGAVVGVGYLGRFHAQKIKAHAEAELVGVCDYSMTQAQTVASELGTKVYEKPEQLFGQVDFVHIAASTQSHYDLAAAFLSQKIPVFVEKPIAASADQAKKLCDLAEKNQTLFTVGHIERFNPAFQFLKKHKADASYLEINRLAPFRSRGADVSVLHDLMIHDIDLVNWIFNEKILSFEISGRKLIKPTYDDVSVRMKLASGLQVTINNSRVTPQIIRNFRVVKKDEVIYVNTATLEAEILKSTAAEPFNLIEKVQLPKADALALEVDHFIQVLLGRKELMTTAREATFALEMVETFISKLDFQAKDFV